MTRPGIGEGHTEIKVSKESLPADREESGGPESPLGKGGSFQPHWEPEPGPEVKWALVPSAVSCPVPRLFPAVKVAPLGGRSLEKGPGGGRCSCLVGRPHTPIRSGRASPPQSWLPPSHPAQCSGESKGWGDKGLVLAWEPRSACRRSCQQWPVPNFAGREDDWSRGEGGLAGSGLWVASCWAASREERSGGW